MSHNRRVAKRQPFSRPACIDVGDGTPPIQCMVTDVSISGARISIMTANDLPSGFSLALTRDGSVHRYCRVTWRSDREIAVVFVVTPKQFRASPVLPSPVAGDGPEIANIV